MELSIIVVAIIIDCLIGDPHSRHHPVVIIGNLISFLEKQLLKATARSVYKKNAGAILTTVTLLMVYGVVWFIMSLLQCLGPVAVLSGGALVLSFTISPRSLAQAG